MAILAKMTTRLAVLALLSSLGAATPTQPNDEVVFGFSSLDLGYFEDKGELHPNTTNAKHHQKLLLPAADDHSGMAVVARKNDHVCSANVGGGWQAHCYGWASAISSIGLFATNVANVLITASNKHECGFYEDKYGPLSVAIHADAPNCHTTSQRATIEGAVTKWIHQHLPYGSCNVQCLHIDHYGNWHGYIAFGEMAESSDIDKVLKACISYHKDENCVSGGKYDRDPH